MVSHAQPTPSQAQLNAQRHAAAMESDIAKRRARKPTDKNMPEGVEDIIVGDGVQQYKSLRDIERRLDALMMRKKLDTQDSSQSGFKRHKTLRIWISNTAENQPWQGRSLDENAFDFNTGIEATYKVKIEGRLVEDGNSDSTLDIDSDDEDEDGNLPPAAEEEKDAMDHDSPVPPKGPKSSPQPRKKFSHFFKAITIDFDRGKNLQPDSATQIEWKKPPVPSNSPNLPAAADFDCLEFERKSDENINCTINLYRDESPERFLLSKDLAEVLDTEEDDRASIVLGLWEYIKAMGLQQDEEKRIIQCDDRLRAVSLSFLPPPFSFSLTNTKLNQLFKTETIFFPHIPDLILNHISPLPPLSLPYTIHVDPTPLPPTTYTIRLPTLSPPTIPPPPRTLNTQDDALALLIQALAHSKAKHAFLTAMSKDPALFVKKWIGSQRRDLEVILGEAGRGEEGLGEEWRWGGRGGVWGTEVVGESVGLMVSKQGGRGS